MSQSCFNFSLNENKRIAEDFGEIETQKLIELYFPDKNPASYNEFISNDKVKEALGLKGITEANKLLNTNYKKEISNQQLINLKSIISQTNNKLKGENKNIVYKLYNVKQLGESDNYTWGIREIKGNLDVDAKIERALTRGKTEQAKNLKNLNDNNQLTLFQLSNKQIIKPGVQELFDSNPELANQVYEVLGFDKSTFDTKGITLSEETSIGWMFIQLNNKKIGRVKFVNNGEKGQLGLSIEINDEYQNKGYGQIVHILMADLARKDYKSNLYSDYQNSSQEIQLLNSLVKKGYAEKIGDVGKASEEYPDSFVTEERAFRIKTSDEIQQITPQQKQQALQLYSQYLDTGKQDIEGFKDFVSSNKLFQLPSNVVNAGLKSVDILSSDKAKQVFAKGEKNKWDLNKILTELGIPKEQKQLIIDSGKTDREEIITDLLANYSYTIEINTAKDKTDYRFKDNAVLADYGESSGYEDFEFEGNKYTQKEELDFDGETRTYFYKNDVKITKKEFNETAKKLPPKIINKNSSYYFSLTVPGGTNYTENEIATPAITPSIKGHAQFATEKGIGWFRSDEVGTNFKEYTYEEAERIHGIVDSTTPTGQFYSGSKTRRILEVQSDLFQKGRDKSMLIKITKSSEIPVNEFVYEDEFSDFKTTFIKKEDKWYDKSNQKYPLTEQVVVDGYNSFASKSGNVINQSKSNQFLQLLNKDNNWVTFFVKSIIQDSAKKGYEKVLFPTGNTAGQIENFIQKVSKYDNEKITSLEKSIENAKKEPFKKSIQVRNFPEGSKKVIVLDFKDSTEVIIRGTSKEDAEKKLEENLNIYLEKNNKIIKKFEKELNELKETVNSISYEPYTFSVIEGIDENKAYSVVNFYNSTITNVLKKQGYNPTIITDEYGNTWNEVEIKQEDLNKILFQLEPTIQKDPTEIIQQVDTLLNDYINNNNIKVEFKDRVLDDNGNDVVAFYNSVKKVIEINQNQRDSKTLPEELAHHLHLALGLDHTLVKRALNLISKVNYKKMLGQDYVQAYDNNDTLLKLELLGKLTAAAVRGETIPVELNNETGNKIWDTIKRMIDAVIRLFKPDTNIQKQLDNLSTEFANMLKSGTKVSSEPTIKTKLYQKNKNLIQLNSKVKPAYVYYTTLLTALKKRQKQFNPLSQEYKMIENQINTVDVALKELITNENELPLIKLVDETIIEVAQGINDFELNFAKGILPSEEELIKYISTLKSFSGFPGVETDVNKLKARLSNFIKSYLINKSSQVLGKEFTEEEVFAITNDVNVLEKNFGTLARTEFTLSRMLGLLIKQKQNTIERENKEAFENIQKATNKLKDWAASNGMTLEQTFDILQQEYRGTRILTKEYTSEFYKLINDTFKLDSEKGKQERAKIATYDDQNKKWIPKSTKYYNPNYQLIHKKGNEALLEYYNFFKKAVQNISDNVLPIELDDYFIPNVYEETLLDILKTQDSVGDKLKDSILHILEFNPFEKMGTIDNQLDVIYDADLIGDKIPLKYIQALPEDKKSKNLSAALLKFMYFANSYKHMSEILPIANLVEESITDPDAFKILQYGNPKLNVAAKSNIVEMVKTIKEMQILGKMRKEDEILNVLGFKMQYGKLIEFGLQYTSKIRLGLNPFAAVANIVIGNLGNIIEAAGGKYFTIGEYFNAVGTFHSESKKVDGLTNVFNPLMEMEDYENLKKLGVGSKEYREKINSLLYLPTRIGERQMQTSTMIAILKHQKIEVKDKNGKVVDKIPMWEAFDNEGKWDAKKMGYTISEQEINKITNRVHGVNQMIHGRYSAKDAAAIQQQALFRALMQFKKWIPAAVEQRFMAKRYDPLLGEETEGRYWAYAKGLRFMMAKLKNDIKKLEENKFTELDWYNMRRNAMELTMIGLLYGLSIFLKAGDDDDELKRNAGYKTYMRLLNSASGDMMQWYLPGTFFDKAMVIPATKTLRSIERTIQYTPYMFGDYSSDASGTYKTGERKDENKFWSNFFSLVPFGSSTSDMYRTWYKDDVSYVQRNR